MASIQLDLAGACGTGGHVRVSLSVDGVSRGAHHFETGELMAPVTDDEVSAAIKVLLRLHAIGKTRAQLRNALQSGITVTV